MLLDEVEADCREGRVALLDNALLEQDGCNKVDNELMQFLS